jgi:hypothetical protein
VGLRRLHAPTDFCAIGAVLVAASFCVGYLDGLPRGSGPWCRQSRRRSTTGVYGSVWPRPSRGLAEAFIWLVEILTTAVVSSISLLLSLGWAWGWSTGFLLGACGGRRLGGVVV